MWTRASITLFGFTIIGIRSITVIDHPYESYEWDCPDDKSVFLQQKSVPWGTPLRAYLTLPSILTLAPSTIPDAGQGVFSRSFIRAYTWLAEYEGEILDKHAEISHYAFRVERDGALTHFIDALNLDVSTYTRWLNGARTPEEQNVVELYCLGKVFFVTKRDIRPGEELLIYYGDSYGELLGINTSLFPNTVIENYKPGSYNSTNELRMRNQRKALANFNG